MYYAEISSNGAYMHSFSCLRWFAVIPSALAGGYAAYFVGGLLNRISITLFLGPPEGWIELISEESEKR